MKIINIKSNLNILLSSHNSCVDFGKYPCTDDQVWFVLVLMFHWNWVRMPKHMFDDGAFHNPKNQLIYSSLL